MSLVKEQAEFLQDAIKLIAKANSMQYVVTGGELWRPLEMQQLYVKTGRSKTMDSQHLKRLAIDLNFFKVVDGQFSLVQDRESLRPLGEYWESLNEKNRWGGNWRGLVDSGKSRFVDCPHFERKV